MMLYLSITRGSIGEYSMTSVSIRQSGGANIISIPKSIVSSLGLGVGAQLELSISDNKIILTPIHRTNLEELLAGSPVECFQMTEEDKEWVNATPKGDEI